MKVKVIQTGVKLTRLAVQIIVVSLKEIGE